MTKLFSIFSSAIILGSGSLYGGVTGLKINNHIYQKSTGKYGNVACVPSTTAMATELLLQGQQLNRNQKQFLNMSNKDKVQYLGKRMGTNNNGTSIGVESYQYGIAEISSGLSVSEIGNLALNKKKMNDIVLKEIKRQPSSFAVSYDYYYELRVELGLIKYYKPIKVKKLSHVVAMSAHAKGSYLEMVNNKWKVVKKNGFLVNDPLMKSQASQHGAKFNAPRFGTYCAKKVLGICYRWKHRSKPSGVAGLTIGNKDNCSGYGPLCKVANLIGEEVHYVNEIVKFQRAPSSTYNNGKSGSSSSGGSKTGGSNSNSQYRSVR